MIKGQFAKNLHKAVSERGVKQVELANAVNVPPTTVSGWFRGAHYPDLEKLMEICDYLDMAVGDLLGDTRAQSLLKYGEYAVRLKNLEDIIEKQKEYISKLEDENEEYEMVVNALENELRADEGMCEVAVNEFVSDFVKELKEAGVKEVAFKL